MWNQLCIRALVCAQACAIAAGATTSGSESAKAGPTLTFRQFQPGQPVRFVVYGDTRFARPSVTKGTDPRIRKWLAERIAAEGPQALLLTGDTPFVGGREADWQDFQDETAPWRKRGILELPTLGNHETYGDESAGIANYLKNFPQIGGHRYYSALLGNVEVISLDCTTGAGAATTQGRWFGDQLSNVGRRVQFLFILYHLPWVADRQTQVFVNLPSKEALNLRSILEAHLPQLRTRVVVFNGHIHNYERFERNSVEYVVTGGGGAEPYPILYRGHADLYRDSAFPVYHYLVVEVSTAQLHAVMWKVKDPGAQDLSVEEKDQFTIRAWARRTGTAPSSEKPLR